MTTQHEGLGVRVKRGLAWSAASAVALRLGGLVVGIILARMLAPAAFGVYAIALTVQSVLLALADLGLGVDLIRAEDPAKRAPTVATLSLASGLFLCLLMTTTASAVARALGSASATPVIMVLSFTLVVASAGVPPYAQLQREFQQKKLFATSAMDFILSTGVTLILVWAGMGPMALAIGRLVAQTAATTAQFLLARMRPMFGFDRVIANSSLRFGLPLAGANLLSWTLLNADNIVIARVAGETALGFYVLAFNIASWPMSTIGQVVRSVSLSAFARVNPERFRDRSAPADSPVPPKDRSLAVGMGYAWAAALPAGALLAVLSLPLISLLYGRRWLPSVTVLAALGIFGALRVAFDMAATYLVAFGASKAVLGIQILWLVALVPAMVVATRWKGIAGGGWAHVVIALAVVAPAYLWAMGRAGADLRALVSVLWPPLVGAVPAAVAATFVSRLIQLPLTSLAAGGLVGCAVYAGLLYRWIRRLTSMRTNLPSVRSDELTGDPVTTPGGPVLVAEPSGVASPSLGQT